MNDASLNSVELNAGLVVALRNIVTAIRAAIVEARDQPDSTTLIDELSSMVESVEGLIPPDSSTIIYEQ